MDNNNKRKRKWTKELKVVENEAIKSYLCLCWLNFFHKIETTPKNLYHQNQKISTTFSSMPSSILVGHG